MENETSTSRQFAQLYRVLTAEVHLDRAEASDMVDSLMAKTLLNPTHAQAIIRDRIGAGGWDIELYLFRDCCYAAWAEAQSLDEAQWITNRLDSIEHERGGMETKWLRLAELCDGNGLTIAPMVRVWAARQEQPVAVYA